MRMSRLSAKYIGHEPRTRNRRKSSITIRVIIVTGLSRVALLEVPSVPSVCPVVEMDYSTALAFGSDL